MFEVGLQSACEEINQAFHDGNLQRVDQLLWPALDQFNELPQLWFYAGNLLFKTGRVALSALCFEHALELDQNELVLANLGAAYRRLNQNEDGMRVLSVALERNPNYEPALVNLGSMFVNEGCPEKGIPHLEKAVALGKARGKLETGAEWNLALLYLEAARFGEGFDLYRNGYGAERLVRKYGHGDVPEPKRLEPEDHRRVQGRERPTLIVYGEQGIGDELMASTVLNDAIEDFDIIFECHPRLERLHRNALWARRLVEEGRPAKFYPTRKDTHIGWPVADNIRADFKCPVLDLAAFYRRDIESFRSTWNKHGPTYTYNVPEAESYRAQLVELAQGRPIIGLATHGGVMSTARQYRTIRLPELEYLFSKTDAFYVCLDYDDMTQTAMYLNEKYPGRYYWSPAVVQHWDFEHTGALLAATDMNVMVCQSAAHLSAGIGAQTRVLTPKRCAWRYAPTDKADEWFWYSGDHVRLYRQDDPESWTGPLDRVIGDINALNRAEAA